MEGCTDGVFHGKRYFFCTWGKGYFCQIDDLQPLSAIHHSTNAGTINSRPLPLFFLLLHVCMYIN